MTTQEQIDLFPYFTQFDTGNFYTAASGGTPTDAQFVFLLNWAGRLIGKYLKLYRPNLTLTLATERYDFNLRDTAVVSREVVQVYGVIVNSIKLRARGGSYGIWSMAELESDDPLWMTRDAAPPQRAAVASDILYLSPKPDATTRAGTHYVAGTILPLDRTSDGNANTGKPSSPELPKELHEAQVMFAAMKAGAPQLAEQDAWARARAYGGEWIEIANAIRMKNGNELLEAYGEMETDFYR